MGDRQGQTASLRARGQQAIDRALVRGKFHAVLYLGLAAIAVALIAGAITIAADLPYRGHHLSPVQAFWQSMIRTLDPGQIADDSGGYRAIGLVTTLLGLLLLSTLISIVNSRFELRIERVRRGREPVRLGPNAEPHYLVLGWTDLTPKVLEELAQSASPAPTVVVVAPVDYSTMTRSMDERRKLNPKRYPRNWPHFRTGEPADKRDLVQLGLVARARSVIVLAADPGSDSVGGSSPDTICAASAEVVKVVTAVTGALVESSASRGTHEGTPTIVAEIPEDSRQGAALAERLERRLGALGLRLIAIDGSSIQARLAAQVSRRAGLSSVYREILDFNGCEIHVMTPPTGIETFGQAVHEVDNATVLGLRSSNTSTAQSEIDLWPKWDTSLVDHDLVVLKDDATALTKGAWLDVKTEEDPEAGRLPRAPRHLGVAPTERVLVVGWNRRGADLLRSLDRYLPPKSRIDVFVRDGVAVDAEALPNTGRPLVQIPDGGLQRWLDDQTESRSCDHAIVLADDDLEPAVSDANVLLTLMALRPPDSESNPNTVVAELRERRNRHLANDRFADDLIVGDSLVALVAAQYAVDPTIRSVLDELIGETDVELDLVRPSDLCLDQQIPAPFANVIAAAKEKGVIALGYRLKDAPRGESDLVLNPKKSDVVPMKQVRQIVVLDQRVSVDRQAVDPAQPLPS